MKTKKVVIACEVMRKELEFFAKEETNIEFRFMEQGLHNTPKQMPALIQEQVDQVQDYASQIILGYGFCSNGAVGVSAPKQPLILPKAHDCIALFMGSRNVYSSYFKENTGTYYLTSGWIDCEGHPLGFLENKYVPKMGREKAEWGIKMEMKDYNSLLFIDNQILDVKAQKEEAKANAHYFDLEYKELLAKTDLLKKIAIGPYDAEDFFIFQPGETITNDILSQIDK